MWRDVCVHARDVPKVCIWILAVFRLQQDSGEKLPNLALAEIRLKPDPGHILVQIRI